MGLEHPSDLRPHHIVRRLSPNRVAVASSLLEYLEPGALLDGANLEKLPEVYRTFWPAARTDSFQAIAY